MKWIDPSVQSPMHNAGPHKLGQMGGRLTRRNNDKSPGLPLPFEAIS